MYVHSSANNNIIKRMIHNNNYTLQLNSPPTFRYQVIKNKKITVDYAN